MAAGEHLLTITAPAAGTYNWPVPKGGMVLGVYSDVPISVQYDDNGTKGTLVRNVTSWEPATPFQPAPFSQIGLVCTAASQISVRYRI